MCEAERERITIKKEKKELLEKGIKPEGLRGRGERDGNEDRRPNAKSSSGCKRRERDQKADEEEEWWEEHEERGKK